MLAYMAKKAYTLRRFSSILRAVSLTPSRSKRVGLQGGLVVTRYQRSASAPSSFKMSHGSTALPLLFDIFCPLLSRMSSVVRQLRYGLFPVRNTEIASSE